MSSFTIYKSQNKSLKSLGILHNVYYFLIALVFAALVSSGAISDMFNIPETQIYFIMAFEVILIVGLILLVKKLKSNLIKLGEIKIAKNGIKKSIGGIIELYEFDSIKEVNIKPHAKTAFFPANNSGSETYLVTLISRLNKIERFVVCSQSIDNPIVDFIDALKNVEKYAGESLKIRGI